MKSSLDISHSQSRMPQVWTLAATIAVILAVTAIRAHADLPFWMQQAVSASNIESALYRLMQIPGISTRYPRPPEESRTELSTLVSKSPANSELYALRARTEEQALDFTAAEQDWKAYVTHAKDTTAARLDLADFYHRRIQPQQEIATLTILAAAPSPASERFTPVARQRSWQAYDRILRIAADQALPPEVAFTTYQAWIARYPVEPSVRAAYINALARQQRFDQALTVIADYKKAFPSDEIFPVKATALVEYRRGSPDRALALYESSFQPLWPTELIESYYGMLAAQHKQRMALAEARARLSTNPDDLASAARIFFYFRQQGSLTNASRVFDEYRLSKEQRKVPWTPDELYTIASLLNNARLYPDAARYYFALYETPGQLTVSAKSSQETALSNIAGILLTAPEQPIGLGSGNLSIYRDIATLDRGPGYLNGILSLWLNSASPAEEFQQEEQRSTPYFRRAKAAEVLALLDKSFPSAAALPALHAALIRAYAAYGDDAVTIAAGNDFLTAFPVAPQRIPIAMIVADAYARTGNTNSEFALYDRLLAELAQKAQGLPLSANAGEPESSTAIASNQSNNSEEAVTTLSTTKPDLDRAVDLTTTPTTATPAPDDLTYSQLLERYLGRLTTANKLPEALVVLRTQLDRNPDDPLLYARLADFLAQNNFNAQQEEVYRRAIARFNEPTFYNRLARFYLRQKRQQDFATLTRQIVDTFHGTALEGYFANVDHTWPQLYLELNLYAHQRFPHELRFNRNLLLAYQTRATRDTAAWELLLREHWFEAEDLRNEFFDYLSRTGKLDAELNQLQTLVPSAAQQQQNPAATRELAEANLWQSHFEQSAPLLGTLARQYPADTTIGDEASSVYRSLAYFDPSQTARAIAIEQNLLRADPANLELRIRIGDTYADSRSTDIATSAASQLAAAAPYWRRLPTIHPGEPDGYLQAATVFWDYFQFDDAVAEITAARKQFHNPTLYGYEAGAIYENKHDPAQAVKEYVTASVSDYPSSAARARLLTLVNRPGYASLIDTGTAQAVASNSTLNALTLRVDVLTTLKRQAEIGPLIDSAIAHSTTADQVSQLAALAQQRQLTSSYQQALQRQIALAVDPVQRIELQYALTRSLEKQNNLTAAQSIIETVYRENPKILGVVRTTTDFYWTNKHPEQAIATLVEASRSANPELANSFTLEAANKSNQSGDYAGARTLLAPLLAAAPFDSRYLTTEADSYALANDNAGLRDFYNTTLASLKTANLPAEDRRDKTALLRQGLIQALTHLKDYSAAVDQHIALISAFPEDPDIAQNAALYALRYNRQQQLVAFLNKTVADSPRDSRFAIILARTDTIFEDYPGALAAYSKAIAIRKDRLDIYVARAALEERLQQFDAACADYDRLYLLSYKDPQWMEKTALARARQGKNDLAVRALQAAWIDGRPASTQNYFQVAGRLETWNLLDQARTFAEQGIRLASDKDPADLLGGPENRTGVAIYARILTRQRHPSDALAALQKALASANISPSSLTIVAQQVEKQGIASLTYEDWRRQRAQQRYNLARQSFQNAVAQIGATVAEFYTPEEKLTYARLLDSERAGKPDNEVAMVWIPAAQSAGLKDREAQWRKDLLLRGGIVGGAQLSPFNELEKQRMQNAERARSIEAYAATLKPQERYSTLTLAADAWADDVNPAAELRLLRSIDLPNYGNAVLRERFFRLLLGSDPSSLLAQASSSNEGYADAAANYILTNATQTLAYSAIDARSHVRQAIWGSANIALAGLFYADKSPRIETAFTTVLGDTTIGERLTYPANRDHQLVGHDWYYYGTRYGVYRTITPVQSADPEDFLSSSLEANPTAAAGYISLAETYADSDNPEAAVREYHHALELTPRAASIHRAIAVTLWPIDKPAIDKSEALEQWKAALANLRPLVETRVVPESFWMDFANIAQDLRARNLGTQLRPEMNAVLRAYVTKNDTYRSAQLLQSAFIALGPQNSAAAVDWLLSLADAGRSPASILAQLGAPWFPRAQLGRLYRRQLELAQAAEVASNAQNNANLYDAGLDQARIRLLNYLLDQKNDKEARTLFGAIPQDQRTQEPFQQVRIELAARQNQVASLIADFTSSPATAPSLQLIASAANKLRLEGDKLANRLLLEYVFQQKFEHHQLTAPDFLALAQARLDANTSVDTTSAIELLRRMTMLPSYGDQDLYTNLDSAATLLIRSNHTAEAILFLTTLSTATPWNHDYRLRLAQAQLKAQRDAPAANTALTKIASTSLSPYATRTSAALALKPASGAKAFDSVELTLLASSNPITPQQATQPYFLPARLAAAEIAPLADRPAIFREAIAVAPSDDLRLAIFRADAALGQNERAIVAIRPLLQSPYGYIRNQGLGAEEPHFTLTDTGSGPSNNPLEDPSDTVPGRAAPLPSLLRTREEKVSFALSVAAVFEKNGSPAEAVSYLRTAAVLNHNPTRSNSIARRIARLDAQLRIEAGNNARRPVIQPSLNQAVIVRPRLAQASISEETQP